MIRPLLLIFKIVHSELKALEFLICSSMLRCLFVLFSLRDLLLVGISLDKRGMLLIVVVLIHQAFDLVFFGLVFLWELDWFRLWRCWSFFLLFWCGFRLASLLSGINGRVDCRELIILLMLGALEFHCT